MLIPKMIHSIKSMSASTLVSSSALPSPVANSIEPTVRRAAPVPWHLWMSASAVSCIVVGGYRHLVLEPGASMSANALVKNFLGRPQDMDAFQHWMAEEFEEVPVIPSSASQ